MTTYKITYKRTGRTGNNSRDYSTIYLHAGAHDKLSDGQEVCNIIDIIRQFEEIAASWGSYETMHSITSIEEV